MLFWAIAVFGTIAVAALLLRPLFAAQSNSMAEPADLTVYRDQLKEVERDGVRGTLTHEEAENLRVEISRRMLAADTAGVSSAQRGLQWPAIGLVVLATIMGLGTYGTFGVPALPDRPLTARLEEEAAKRADRPAQAEAEAMIAAQQTEEPPAPNAEQLDLIDRLEELLQERPDDLRGHKLLSSNLANLGLFSRAAQAQTKVIAIQGADAGADDHFAQAEYFILAANGYVSPEAEAALKETLATNPRDPRARYYSGLLAFQSDRADIAYDLWTRLLDEGPENAPWIAAIRAQIGTVAVAAGRSVPRGPDADDIAAAEAMSAEDRTAMIEGMVAGLADRLAEDGGAVEEWERLIRAYGVLNETAKASDAWEDAQAAFEGDPVALNLLRQAARDAEVAQ